MDRLWTPWRMAFIEQASAAAPAERPACFLCAKPAEGAARDHANLILYRGPRAYVLMNLYPYNSGHLMVAPYAHGGDLVALPAPTADELFALTQRAVGALSAEYHPDGFNVGMNLGQAAGAGVPNHLHLHVVPRWNGDTNFMPVVGDTKVLPESLEQTYDRLWPRFHPETPTGH
ncbi:MAG TPA: HIT domain-containing protein [Chloroflexota bacterium]|nr:HIT domain-containing protein [Chloroflexota bacterium]